MTIISPPPPSVITGPSEVPDDIETPLLQCQTRPDLATKSVDTSRL